MKDTDTTVDITIDNTDQLENCIDMMDITLQLISNIVFPMTDIAQAYINISNNDFIQIDTGSNISIFGDMNTLPCKHTRNEHNTITTTIDEDADTPHHSISIAIKKEAKIPST